MNDSSSKKSSPTQTVTLPNSVQERREALLLSKAELARKAGVSALTIDRVEKGSDCRMDTKRKILLALGLKLSDRKTVFHDDSAEQADTEASRSSPKNSNEG